MVVFWTSYEVPWRGAVSRCIRSRGGCMLQRCQMYRLGLHMRHIQHTGFGGSAWSRDLFRGSLDLVYHDLRTLEKGVNSSILRFYRNCPVLPLLDISDIPYDPRMSCLPMDGIDQYPPKGSKRTYFRGPGQDSLWVPSRPLDSGS